MTAIRIQTQETFIPIELGDLTLKFDVSDGALLNLREKMTDVQRASNELDEDAEDEEVIEQVKGIIRDSYDELFGKGTFDKVYKISPSVFIVTQYFFEIGKGISEEMEKRGFTLSQQEKAKEYLTNKKK